MILAQKRVNQCDCFNLPFFGFVVIIDELGRGTSTEEGSALCWAISEEFANSAGAFTFLATHFQIITKLEDCCIGVVKLVPYSLLSNDFVFSTFYCNIPR